MTARHSRATISKPKPSSSDENRESSRSAAVTETLSRKVCRRGDARLESIPQPEETAERNGIFFFFSFLFLANVGFRARSARRKQRAGDTLAEKIRGSNLSIALHRDVNSFSGLQRGKSLRENPEPRDLSSTSRDDSVSSAEGSRGLDLLSRGEGTSGARWKR
jgi:hypothetical protein